MRKEASAHRSPGRSRLRRLAFLEPPHGSTHNRIEGTIGKNCPKHDHRPSIASHAVARLRAASGQGMVDRVGDALGRNRISLALFERVTKDRWYVAVEALGLLRTVELVNFIESLVPDGSFDRSR